MTNSKKIGFWTCTALVVGNTIGMGIFLLPASLAPYGFNALIGWGITVLGCMAMARVFARLAREMPGADGPYGYIRATLGDIPAFIALWSYWVSLWITNAALATGVVGYIDAAFPELAQLQPSLFALGLLWSFVAVNLFGVRSRRRRADRHHGAEAGADGRRGRARRLGAVHRAVELRQPSADHAGAPRRRDGRLDDRAVRDAGARVGDGAGREGREPRPHAFRARPWSAR